MDKIGRNFGFTAEEFCKGAENTVVAITGHESDAKDVSNSFVDFSIHFAIMTDSDNVLKVQDSLMKDVRELLHEKYGL